MLRKAIIALVLLAMAGYAGYQQFTKDKLVKQTIQAEEAMATAGPEIGKPAPDFELQALDGSKVKLSALKGKKVILNFWATWCPPCKEEMPDMQKYYTAHQNDVVIVAVNYTVSERANGQEKVRTFASENGLTFPILLDTQSTVSNTYKVISLPTSYFVDEKGIVRQKYIGPMSEAFMEQTIKNMQ
ncbi:redoxin domain-containing protein [Ectobacillus sp. JY-23]|uniref:peroxiredoxin family protein n=1 Tax=Ectobacillus sp. JY-23 TaxID=2933872 RepID=UPI001FF5D0F7|nr:redoxin domain-containing protein [Ectobacillus sp. JY-23]UOY93232.1 redoxin domain-containing protein [Ectobacillus sp. JY-23]